MTRKRHSPEQIIAKRRELRMSSKHERETLAVLETMGTTARLRGIGEAAAIPATHAPQESHRQPR